jgi:outer membrane protein OmpA-like peptidoglycan-associated protein
MKYTKLLFWIGSMLLVGTVTIAAQSTDAGSSSPNIAQFPVVNLGPEQQVFDQNVKDVQFDYDDHIIDSQAEQSAVNVDAEWLKAHPDARFYIDGYADERGDIPYNMTLSQKRAEAVKAALMERGVPEDRILITVGFGKLYPICADQDDACWQENRRVHLVYVPPSFDVNSTNTSK